MPGSPSNVTLWVKLSSLVHVTVAPASTTIAAGANLYDFGRSTVVVATGEAFVVAPPEQPARATMATARTATGRYRQEMAVRRFIEATAPGCRRRRAAWPR